MKKLLLCVIISIVTIAHGQDYKLFNATSKKLFNNLSEPVNTYSLSIESAHNVGVDSVYYNFFGLASWEIESDTCEFWGGPYCKQQNAQVWTGPKIVFNNQNDYQFFNQNNDTIFLSFNIEIDGPIPIYSDSVQHFSMMHVGDDTLTLLSEIDSTRIFTISHFDNDGNTIESPLNGHNIVISKKFGLASFFVIDSFPEVLKPIKLIGNVSPNAGLYQITDEMIYDHQPGDEIQFNEYEHYYGNSNPPWYNFNRYNKLTFISRSDTEDSIIYKARRSVFYIDSIGVENDTVALKYLRDNIVAQIPFEKFDKSNRRLYQPDYCGQILWTYTTNSIEDIGYCEADTCWGIIDLGRPPEEKFKSIVCGLGTYNDDTYVVGPDGYHINNKIVYFKKNGLSCGTEVIVGVNEIGKQILDITVSPNPANESVNINSPIVIEGLYLFNISGTILSHIKMSETKAEIDARNLPAGFYILKICLENEQNISKKIMVSHDR